MRSYVVSPAAEQDIQAILAWTDQQFGKNASVRYEALIIQAVEDLVDAPQRPGSHDRKDVAPAVRVYHLRHSRAHVTKTIGRVKKPRHVLLFRIRTDGAVEIGRVLHDSMELEKQVPAAFRTLDDVLGNDTP